MREEGERGLGSISGAEGSEEEREGRGAMLCGVGRRHSGYSFSKRSIMRERVESRNWRRPGGRGSVSYCWVRGKD